MILGSDPAVTRGGPKDGPPRSTTGYHPGSPAGKRERRRHTGDGETRTKTGRGKQGADALIAERVRLRFSPEGRRDGSRR